MKKTLATLIVAGILLISGLSLAASSNIDDQPVERDIKLITST